MRRSVVPSSGAKSPPHVVVIGNQKGGSGKSTFAMHIIVALLKAGKRVASFDLDLNQLTLTRYRGNRHKWVRKQGQKLEVWILNGLSSGILRLRTMLRRYRDEGA